MYRLICRLSSFYAQKGLHLKLNIFMKICYNLRFNKVSWANRDQRQKWLFCQNRICSLHSSVPHSILSCHALLPLVSFIFFLFSISFVFLQLQNFRIFFAAVSFSVSRNGFFRMYCFCFGTRGINLFIKDFFV